MPTPYLGANLDNLKKQAKSLLKSVREKDRAALGRITPYVKDRANFKLNDAQLVIARELGHASWAGLKTFLVESIGAFVAAANNGDVDAARAMLAREPRLAQTPRALFRAAAMGKNDMVRLLVEHGADVNAATVEESSYVGTPLLAAAEMLNDVSDTVALLLKHGANPNLEVGGGTPLQMAMGTYARTPHKHDVIELLLDAGATHDQPEAVMAIHRGRIDLLTAELDADPHLVHRRFEEVDYLWLPFNHPGPTLLHIAADYGEVEMGRLLLSRGADINARAGGTDGQSPIFHTVASWSVLSGDGHCLPFLKLLLAQGADLDLRANVQFETFGASSCEGQTREVTPLDFALAFAEGPAWRNSQAAVVLLQERAGS